jgi:transcriptional regulator NrdR family protein
MFKVLKNDGSVQDFSWKKIIDGVVAAGGSEEEAKQVAQEVETWLTVAAPDGTIKSYDLHMRVIELLKEINPGAGGRFEEYKKPVKN